MKINFSYKLLLLFLFGSVGGFCQVNDSTKLVSFALFLEESQEYKFAAQEYERLFHLYPNESKHFVSSIRNYRKAGYSNLINERIKNSHKFNEVAIGYYALSLMDESQFPQAENLLIEFKEEINSDLLNRLDLDLYFYQGHYKKALDHYKLNNYNDPQYYNFIEEGLNLNQKNPLAAGVLSGIIPGLGRVYTKDYKDGIISLLFVASTAYQAYRRFHKNGIKSASGWIYGGIAAGFYIGNIYGSVRSAKLYNSTKIKKHNAKAKSYIDLYYSDL